MEKGIKAKTTLIGKINFGSEIDPTSLSLALDPSVLLSSGYQGLEHTILNLVVMFHFR